MRRLVELAFAILVLVALVVAAWRDQGFILLGL